MYRDSIGEGDLIQLDSWRAHLPRYGIAADARVAGWRDFEAWDLIFLAHAQFSWARELLQEDFKDKALMAAAITHGRPEADVVASVVYRAAKVICYAEAEAEFYRETFPGLPEDRFVVLPMGVPAGLYDYCARKHSEPRAQSLFMAARYDALAAVVIGTTLGMMIANLPAVWLGERLALRVDMKAMRWIAAALFVALGIVTLLVA